jgi:hypothetical protein
VLIIVATGNICVFAAELGLNEAGMRIIAEPAILVQPCLLLFRIAAVWLSSHLPLHRRNKFPDKMPSEPRSKRDHLREQRQ